MDLGGGGGLPIGFGPGSVHFMGKYLWGNILKGNTIEDIQGKILFHLNGFSFKN